MTRSMNRFALSALLLGHLAWAHSALAMEHRSRPVVLSRPISSPYYPVVLKGKDLPPLLKTPLGKIALWALGDGGFKPIPFQIDRRDAKGRFQIPVTEKEVAREAEHGLDLGDELVFMVRDLGTKVETLPGDLVFHGATEIEIVDPETDQRRWAYAIVSGKEPLGKSTDDYVSYSQEDDWVESDTYRIGFSRKTPFVIDTLKWKDPKDSQLSPDIADIMKAKHTGRFLHKIDFERTHEDSESILIAVKDGPVRVIRTTENRARIIMQFRTAKIYIDSIHYANAFFMDSWVDIPFKIGRYFSDLVTLMTMDGNSDPSLPQARVYSDSLKQGALIDGRMSAEEHQINASPDRHLAISSSYGNILVSLDIDKRLPVKVRAFIMDDSERPDPPEQIPGQFGNLGFRTTGWEKVVPSVYRMAFVVYMIRDVDIQQGLKILKKSPSPLK